MKHPGPWRYDEDMWQIADATGETVVCYVGEKTAAPLLEIQRERDELLAALKQYVERDARNSAVRSSDDPRLGGCKCRRYYVGPPT